MNRKENGDKHDDILWSIASIRDVQEAGLWPCDPVRHRDIQVVPPYWMSALNTCIMMDRATKVFFFNTKKKYTEHIVS